MSDTFEPEADRLEQEQEVTPPAIDDDEPGAGSAVRGPESVPADVPEADALEQAQEVEDTSEEEPR